MKSLFAVLVALLVTCGCSGSGGSAPTAPSTPTAPTRTTFNLSGGVVDNKANSNKIPNATLTVATGSNSGRSTTSDGAGNYKFTDLTPGTFTVTSKAANYQDGSQSVTLGNADTTANIFMDPVPVAPPPPSGPRTSFSSGTYLVNRDIAAGRYFARASSSCYWERDSGLGGTLGEIIANNFLGFSTQQTIVDILTSDLAFHTESGCNTWGQSPLVGSQSTIIQGWYLVGSQVTPGTYQANASSGCYWERLRNFQGTIGAIISNNFVSGSGQQLVAIGAGDVGFDSNQSCGTWTRVGSQTIDRIEQPPSLATIEANWRASRNARWR